MTDSTALCSVAGCSERARSKGLCRKHYRRHYYETHRAHEIRTATDRARGRERAKPPG